MNGETRNNTLDTINAAANAIASTDNRMPQASSIQKRRWGSCWSLYWCFGSNKQKTRIGHAVLVPESSAGTETTAAQNLNQAPPVILPFVAPPSSPASFLQSEPPSTLQSPSGMVSHSANMYSSPSGPASMFAIGPYANETQLVSPPVFSTYNTEPSTAPVTPPPESLQLMSPSSPEVPFARLLGTNHQNDESNRKYSLPLYESQPYNLHPGSPVGQLISPMSGNSNSGTSSPFPDRDSAPGQPHFLDFRNDNPSMLLNLEKLSPREWGSWQRSGSLTPNAVGRKCGDRFLLEHQISNIATVTDESNVWEKDGTSIDRRVSFEIPAKQVVGCVERKLVATTKALSMSECAEPIPEGEENLADMANDYECHTDATSDEKQQRTPEDMEDVQRHHKHQSVTLETSKEFIFDSADGRNTEKPTIIGSDWWANEKVINKEVVPSESWTFFPVMQPSVS